MSYPYTPSTPMLETCIEQACAEYNAAAGTNLTPQEWWQMDCEGRARDLGRRYARIAIASGIDRLTGAEFARIKAARAASQAVDDAVRPIFESRSVELAGPLWQQGIAALAAAGLLDTPTDARVAALLAPPQPGETLV